MPSRRRTLKHGAGLADLSPVHDLYASLAATAVAIVAGWATVHHCLKLRHEGMTFDDGGGWTALILVEFVSCMVAAGVAVNL